MKISISILFIFSALISFKTFAQDERPNDLWTWMIAGKQRLVISCHSRGIVDIDSFDSELALISRTTNENGCEIFDVLHINESENEAWLTDIHVNATIYGLDRLKRSPSTLIKPSFLGRVIYPIKLLGIRKQTNRLGKKLTKFLEYGEFPRTERVSEDYLRLFVEQAQIAHDDYLTLSR